MPQSLALWPKPYVAWFDIVDERPDDATADADVRALEDVAYVLTRVAPEDRDRLRELLGAEMSENIGLE